MDHRRDLCWVGQWLQAQVLHSLDAMPLYCPNKRLCDNCPVLVRDPLLHNLEALLVVGLDHAHHVGHGKPFEFGVSHDVAEEAVAVWADGNALGFGVVAQEPGEGLGELDYWRIGSRSVPAASAVVVVAISGTDARSTAPAVITLILIMLWSVLQSLLLFLALLLLLASASWT